MKTDYVSSLRSNSRIVGHLLIIKNEMPDFLLWITAFASSGLTSELYYSSDVYRKFSTVPLNADTVLHSIS